MADFSIRSDSVDVEQIMQQIRSRIREKRGVDYTEDQIRALATVRLEKFLDPKNLRSDLLEQFRKSRPPLPTVDTVELPYTFDDQTLFATHRGPLQFMRKLLRPVLKLFFNPNTLNQILHRQSRFNGELLVARAEWNVLYYELLHNLVLETTRTGIEVKNLQMRVESLSSRLDFSERRVRALEGVVQYRPEAVPSQARRALAEGEGFPDASDAEGGSDDAAVNGSGDGTARRRRRRRRGRRSGGTSDSPAADETATAAGADEETGVSTDTSVEAGDDTPAAEAPAAAPAPMPAPRSNPGDSDTDEQ